MKKYFIHASQHNSVFASAVLGLILMTASPFAVPQAPAFRGASSLYESRFCQPLLSSSYRGGCGREVGASSLLHDFKVS
ncbi:hypothetical protein PAMC26577_04575 [Caballeronia sordidicola]|uniref:Secreted protein n=1 Tax=Caballeronia sordidicola TaxID=196367 RepID=A0A242N451_CABSO|nr:hypothetical protein PAMC26577_04575 [Caballeronia sordidicola]